MSQACRWRKVEDRRAYAGVPNLTRLETYGDTALNWLKVTADPNAPGVFSWLPQTVPAT
jgi:hypothetical protein